MTRRRSWTLLWSVPFIAVCLFMGAARAQQDAAAPPAVDGGQLDGGIESGAEAPATTASVPLAAPVAAAPPPAVAPLPAPPPEPDDGPGDQEAKADHQRSRSLPDHSFRGQRFGVEVSVYGSARLTGLRDSTQSFLGAATNQRVERQGTYRGDHGSNVLTTEDSRVGLSVGTPRERQYRFLVLAELESAPRDDGDNPSFVRRLFAGLIPRPLGEFPSVPSNDAADRSLVRHLFVGLSSPYVHLLVGKYHDLFGWGGRGFFPSTAALVAPPGVAYRQRAQVRLSLLLRFAPVDFEAAAAVFEPVQTDGDGGEAQAGLRFAINGWRGASAQGGGPPEAAPMQIGLSGLGRTFRVNEFRSEPEKKISITGHGAALDLFLPIVPARGSNLANAVSVTAQLTKGSGIADLYPALTGGAKFLMLPNPNPQAAALPYSQNVRDGLVAFDRNLELQTITWSTVALGLQYHLPFSRGRRVWLSALYTRTHSENLKALTPSPSWVVIFPGAAYYDINAFVRVTRGLQLALSHQVTRQTFGDVSGPSLVSASASNRRQQLTLTYFF